MLEIIDLNFGYGESPVLENINFKIADGEFVGIIGPNGAGKSTLLKLVAGLMTDKGHIFYDHKQLKEYSRKNLAKLIGYVPQETEFSFSYPV